MRLISAATILLACVSGCASVQDTSTHASSSHDQNISDTIPGKNGCGDGTYRLYGASINHAGAIKEDSDGACIHYPDYEKSLIRDYKLTREEIKDWFSKGADEVELPPVPATHGTGTKEYKILQTLKKVNGLKTLEEVVGVIGFTLENPTVSASASCMAGSLRQDSISVKYKVGNYEINCLTFHTCNKEDSYWTSGTVSYVNSKNSTCIDYADFNDAFGTVKPHEESFRIRMPKIISREGVSSQMDRYYIYPSYSSSKTCMGEISAYFGNMPPPVIY